MEKTQQQVISDLIQRTMAELGKPEKPVQTSRSWNNPKGYMYLVQWSNLVLFRHFVRLFTNSLPKKEYRRKIQLDDAARSDVRNIEEGYKRSNTSAYIEFISFTQGSLEECKGDIRELTDDGFLPSRPGSSLESLGIDLGAFNRALRPDAKYQSSNNPLYSSKGNLKDFKGKLDPESDKDFAYRPLPTLYPPLSRIKASDLTYEIFMELINKSDYLLRKLVVSLEKKLQNDRLGYKIAQAKIRDKIR